jgi:hypothetical protein
MRARRIIAAGLIAAAALTAVVGMTGCSTSTGGATSGESTQAPNPLDPAAKAKDAAGAANNAIKGLQGQVDGSGPAAP